MKKFIIITSAIIIVIVSALLIYYFADNYDEFYSISTAEYDIPGLDDGFTPQGIAYVDENNVLMSGYMKDGSLSRIYVVNPNNNSYKYVTLSNDSEGFYGHCGGITTDGQDVWIASEKTVYRLSLEELLNTERNKEIEVIDTFTPCNNADFICYKDGYLWIGEFYHKSKYPTDPSHHFKVSEDITNHSIVSQYSINSDKPCKIEETPNYIISVPDLCQGMAFSNSNKVILSTSYSIANSNIYVFPQIDYEAWDTVLKVNGIDVPVYHLVADEAETHISAPCMSEEIYYNDGKVYILFESACKKYKIFVREALDKVYSIQVA